MSKLTRRQRLKRDPMNQPRRALKRWRERNAETIEVRERRSLREQARDRGFDALL